MLGLYPTARTCMSFSNKGGFSDNQMLLSFLNRTGCDKKCPIDRMSNSELSDKMTRDSPSDVFPDDFLHQLDQGTNGSLSFSSPIAYTGSFRTEFGEGISGETDRLANSFEVERLLIGISESNEPTFNANQTDSALPEDLASVSLMQTDTPFSRGPVVCGASLSAPFSSLPNNTFDFTTTNALDSVFSVPTTTDSLVLDLLTHGQYRSQAVTAPLSRQDSLIESLPSNTSQLSEQFSSLEQVSDSSSNSFSDHLNFTQTSHSKKALELPPPGRPGRKPGPNCNRSYKRRVVPKDTEEYLIKRAKNNIAIRKCREKAKKKQEEMDDKMRQLENENSALRQQVDDLKAEVSRLKGGSK